jgi:hypothetical protein
MAAPKVSYYKDPISGELHLALDGRVVRPYRTINVPDPAIPVTGVPAESAIRGYAKDPYSGALRETNTKGRVIRGGRVIQPDMNLPGVGGPTTTAAVAAANAAAFKSAAAAAPPVPPKTVKQTTATKPAGADGAGGAQSVPPPVVSGDQPASDGEFEWSKPMSYYEDLARTSLQGDIDTTRSQYDRQQAALKAQQEGAAKLLADFGKSVAQYYANAATTAGQGYDTQAAAQALLGAVGQRAFTGQGAGRIASDLAAAGNGQLGRTLASQETGRNAAVGAILNRIIGTDKASEYLTGARNATTAALANAAAQGSYGQRLLAGLNAQQTTALNELLGKRADFEAKLPGVIQTRAQEMSDRAFKNAMAQEAFGLKVQGRKDLNDYRERTLNLQERRIDAAAKKASNLTPAQDLELRAKAARVAKALADGVETVTLDADNKVKSRSVKAMPVKNYQQALKQLAAQAPNLPPEYYLTLLNQFPKWSVPGQNGRPFIDMITRGVLVSKGYDPSEVYAAAFDPAQYARFKPIIQGLS